MVTYKCDKCNKIFNHKVDYIRHTKRKNPCQLSSNIITSSTCSVCNKVFSNKYNLRRHLLYFCISQNNLNLNSSNYKDETKYKINYNLEHSNDNKHINKSCDKITPSLQIEENSLNSQKVTELKKELKCKNCNKKFTRKDNLTRHLNTKCKINTNDSNINNNQELIKQLLNEMKELKDKISKLEHINHLNNNNNNNSNITNNQNNQTNITNNNFQIVAFGKEELENIVPDDICKKILFKGFEAIPGLIEYVHFNENKPEYHNCFISNMRDKYAITYDGINWNLTEANEVINTLKDDKQIFLENKFEEFYDSLNKTTQNKFKKFLGEKDSDILVERYKDSIRLLLYNKRGIIIKTKNKLENNIPKIK